MQTTSTAGLTLLPLGLSSDSQIFLYNDLKQKIKANTFGFPQAGSLLDHGPQVEYLIMGDDAFPLRTLLPQKHWP